MFSTPGVQRGCGSRKQGGIYLEVATGPGGLPLDHFITDPPQPFTTDVKIGVTLVDRTEPDGVVVTHVIDWIGTEHYPFAADFIEEGRRFGFSRRVAPSIEFHRLSARSRLLVVHARGLVTNRGELYGCGPHDPADDEVGMPPDTCARFATSGMLAHFADPLPLPPGVTPPACNRYQYVDAEPTHVHLIWDGAVPPLHVERAEEESVADFVARVRRNYMRPDPAVGKHAPPHIEWRRRHASATYRVFPPQRVDPVAPAAAAVPALIATLPVGGFTVVTADDDSHASTFDRVARGLQGTGLAVEETDA